ncbi:MAG: CPBP family intramembrane glutamic endopeptidase [Pricia sp.]
MSIKQIFINKNRPKALWRIVIFFSTLLLAVSPLSLLDNTYLQFIGAVVILMSVLYLNSKYLDKRGFQAYGLTFTKEFFVHLSIGILIGFFSVVLVLLIGKTTGIISVSEFLPISRSALLIPFAFKMLLVAILEETLFRGYVFTNLYDGFKSKKISKKKALLISLIISSVLFGLAHFNNNNATILSIIFLSINGIVWCIPFILTKNLGLSIGLHTAWNFTQTQLGFTMSGNEAQHSLYKIDNIGADLLTGGEYGPEAGVLGLIGFGAMLMISLTYLKLTHKNTSIFR